MNHWITLTADMLPEVIDQAELDAITAADWGLVDKKTHRIFAI